MITMILACMLAGPCEGGKCAILPRLRTADSIVERHRTVTKEVKVTAEVTKESTKARKLVATIKARPHRGAKIVKAVCLPWR